MKELTIVCIILIIIIAGSLFINKYIKDSSQQLIRGLYKLKENVSQNIDINNLKKDVERIYNSWEKTEEKWSLIISHSELDLIETGFIRLKAQVEEGELERSIEEIDATIFLVNHISEKEKFCLKNIF